MVETAPLPTALRTYAAHNLDTSELIADSPFTVKWLLDILTASDDKFQVLTKTSKVTKVTGIDLSQGKGFASKVYKVTIEFDDQNEKHIVCLKVPETESFNEAFTKDEMGMKLETGIKQAEVAMLHNRECDFYEKYAPHLDIPLPKVYKTIKWIIGEQQGAILMESFFGETTTMPVSAGLTTQQLYNLAKQMATWHSYILSLPKEEWMGNYPATMFDSFCEGDFLEAALKALKEKNAGRFDEAVDTLGPLAKSLKFFHYCWSEVYLDVGLPPVLAHGDLWTNNILWKKNPDGSIANELAAIIDWQAIHDGCMTADLARFMAICADAEVRREHEFKILQFYYDEVVKNFNEKGKTAEFTMDQLTKAYKANFIVHAMFLMCMGPLLFPDVSSQQPDYKVKKAEREKILLRAEFAAKDAMEYLKDVPEDIKNA
ncbi:hypothetical protein L596_023368 [Steinernema carpocapsae]|uniref:CHK kinase-like domain-containing protein n=1 Tax=Steinernema carpocapsae TaxID=34508 RepID=A0A4U5MDE7_STECR|nr:hypothetical protein L596_023368 [Steinernema carpocapsae]